MPEKGSWGDVAINLTHSRRSYAHGIVAPTSIGADNAVQ